MKPEGAPRPPLITVPEPPAPDTQEGSAADALRTWLIEPLRDGLKETYRVLVTPDKPPIDERTAAPEPHVVVVWPPTEQPPVAPPDDAERTLAPVPPPVSAEERRDQHQAQARIDEILAELQQATDQQGQR